MHRKQLRMVLLVSILSLLTGALQAKAEVLGRWTVTNHADIDYQKELLRLDVKVPEDVDQQHLVVFQEGKAILHQLERIEDDEGEFVRFDLWVCIDLKPANSTSFAVEVVDKKPNVAGEALVKLKGSADETVTMSNRLFAIELTGSRDSGKPGPIVGFGTKDDKQVSSSFWEAGTLMESLKTEILADGPLFTKVRQTYTFFAPLSAPEGTPPGKASMTYTLKPEQPFATIEESFDMGSNDGWVLDLSDRFRPKQGLARKWYKAQNVGADKEYLEVELKPNDRLGKTLLYLRPRWTQSYDVGWFFGVTDEDTVIGPIVARAGLWDRPYASQIDVRTTARSNTAELFLPTDHGKRYWLLLAIPERERVIDRPDPRRSGRTISVDRIEQLTRETQMQSLNKLTHEYILNYPGHRAGDFSGEWFYSNLTNPTDILRRTGESMMQRAKEGSLPRGNRQILSNMQVRLDPDWFAYYHNGWSPINPNFATDFVRIPIIQAMSLDNHPQYDKIKAMAENAFRTDLYYAVTLPGGAGQESPGYQWHAMQTWRELAPLAADHLGFDPQQWPRYQAAAQFLWHTSVPEWGNVRRIHPLGDTHPPGEFGNKFRNELSEFTKLTNPRQFQTEELPGFGVIFRNDPGTPQETFLSFKAGPNRGHNHGDQLSIHYVDKFKRLAIDHMSSYKPRANMEHMHNRVAFSSNKFDYANMDGYERTLAFKTTLQAAVAVGQVSSNRLREVKKLPPEEWNAMGPYQPLEQPLIYRRTIVQLKKPGGPKSQDVFVIRDQWWGPDLKGTYCLHVDANSPKPGRDKGAVSDKVDRQGGLIAFEDLLLYIASPLEFEVERLDWGHDRGPFGPEKTIGIRLPQIPEPDKDMEGRFYGQFITVLTLGDGDKPEFKALSNGVSLDYPRGKATVEFDGAVPEITEEGKTEIASIRLNGRKQVLLKADELDEDRSQGEVGLFVPEAGYDFGPIPDWLRMQREKLPDNISTNYLKPSGDASP